MRAYPGTVRYSDLSDEQVDGLILAIPSLEARSTINLVNAASAMLGGAETDSSDYLDALVDLAYQDEPTMQTKAKEMIRVGEAKRRSGMNSHFSDKAVTDA